MSRKKTREQKIKSAQRSSAPKITYSYKAESQNTNTVVVSTRELDYHKKEIRLIIIATAIIFALNIGLYILLTTNTLHLGFLGY